MEWREYFEGSFLTEPGVLLQKIPLLESMGPTGEVIMAIGYLSLEGSKEAATVLLEKALQMGMTFTADEMSQIACNCTDEGCKKAFYKSAKTYSSKDLEELKYVIEDDWIIDVAKKYHIKLPKCYLEPKNTVSLDDAIANVIADINTQVDEIQISRQTFIPQKRQKVKWGGFSDEEILIYGLYPDDELYKMSLISRILGKK